MFLLKHHIFCNTVKSPLDSDKRRGNTSVVSSTYKVEPSEISGDLKTRDRSR